MVMGPNEKQKAPGQPPVDPAFLAIMRFPLKKGETRFFFFVIGKPFKKTVWSRHLFLFYFKGENKIRNKNPKCDS